MSSDQSEQLFTREQVEQIIEEISRKLNLDRSIEGPTNLSNEILEELENSSSVNLQKNIKEFVKNLPKYEGSEWTNSEIFNKEFHRELKRKTVDALQSTNAVYKGADRLIIAGRAATDLYEGCQQFLESGGSEEQFFLIMEGIRQLAVYSYATSKAIKSEAKTMAIKALRLPDSVKHLEEEPSDKKCSGTTTTITEDLDVEPSTGLFLDAARAKYTRRPKAPINPNNTAINASVFPHDNGALRHIKRWYITRGPSPTFLRAMETGNTSFMACVSSNTRISTSVEPQTSTMEIYSLADKLNVVYEARKHC
ncbi:uncharacterized protein RHIMIDRAFT_235303 [Rhizopus microsporus ATCC 52813]|uniref:Uncharacterized protein n=1 Tax=Rhizopus microsporus ATCC 52813 TaxID=1340429 RepID=A0A2G4T0L0_RHIZD|nr:uncharacterized protein RHIMIDRAFT_235303 [Rhizopus microsporus ATCC 52813]PHZ14527.1 hypothetical protein RHIMIDRAFT_235303 [Rhizopus microsporus ATCC 52813]